MAGFSDQSELNLFIDNCVTSIRYVTAPLYDSTPFDSHFITQGQSNYLQTSHANYRISLKNFISRLISALESPLISIISDTSSSYYVFGYKIILSKPIFFSPSTFSHTSFSSTLSLTVTNQSKYFSSDALCESLKKNNFLYFHLPPSMLFFTM